MQLVISPEELTQLRPSERAAVADYLARLRALFGERVLRVILFGSRARGDGDRESDLDLLVVVDDGDWRFHDQIADESVEPWLTHRSLISPITMDCKEYEQLQEWRTLFFRNLERDGIELWTAEPGSVHHETRTLALCGRLEQVPSHCMGLSPSAK